MFCCYVSASTRVLNCKYISKPALNLKKHLILPAQLMKSSECSQNQGWRLFNRNSAQSILRRPYCYLGEQPPQFPPLKSARKPELLSMLSWKAKSIHLPPLPECKLKIVPLLFHSSHRCRSHAWLLLVREACGRHLCQSFKKARKEMNFLMLRGHKP